MEKNLEKKITADGDCSHEIKRRLLLGGKVMTNLDSILKSRDFTLSTKVHLGEGNGTPLQYSCLENPMDGKVWWAAVHGVAKSRTRLKRLSSSSSVKKAERGRIDAFELWCWRRGPGIPWSAGDQTSQS